MNTQEYLQTKGLEARDTPNEGDIIIYKIASEEQVIVLTKEELEQNKTKEAVIALIDRKLAV